MDLERAQLLDVLRQRADDKQYEEDEDEPWGDPPDDGRSRLACCARGAKFVGFRHDSDMFYAEYADLESYMAKARSTPPAWGLYLKPYVLRWDHASEERVHVAFCPFCGTKVPEVRLRADPPVKICAVLDSGYYCATCEERLQGCRCDLPERLWERVPCTG